MNKYAAKTSFFYYFFFFKVFINNRIFTQSIKVEFRKNNLINFTELIDNANKISSRSERTDLKELE